MAFYHSVSIKKLKFKEGITRNAPLLIISVIGGLSNVFYYHLGLYKNIHTISENRFSISGEDLLQIGRSFSQFILPYSNGTIFNAASFANIVGLFLLLLFLIIGYKSYKIKRNYFPFWTLLCLTTQITYLVNLKEFYLVNYYLLLPNIFYGLAMIEIIKSLSSNKLKKYILIIMPLLIFHNLYRTFGITSVIDDELAYFEKGYLEEGGCYNINFFAKAALRYNNYQKLKEIAPIHMSNSCYLANSKSAERMAMLSNYMVYLRDDININKRIIFFTDKPKTPKNLFALSGLLAKSNNSQTSQVLKEFFELTKNIKLENKLRDNLIADDIFNYCKTSKSQSCYQYLQIYKRSKYIPPFMMSTHLLRLMRTNNQ